MKLMLNTVFSVTVLLNKVIGQPMVIDELRNPINHSVTVSLTEDERQKISAILKSSLDKFNSAILELSEEQFSFRAKSDSWTIGECIEHITRAELCFPEIVQDEMKKPSEPDNRKKIRISDNDILRKMKNRFWKARSPEVLKPTGKYISAENSIIAFRDQRARTMEYVNTTEDDLRNHFWRHPVTGTIDLYQTIILMSAHLERHIAQIEEIKQCKRFPIMK